MADVPIDGPQAPVPTIPTEERWGQPISDARQAELDALAERQRAWAGQTPAERGDSPCKSVWLNGADVFWLALGVLAGVTGNPAQAETILRTTGRTGGVSRGLAGLHLEGADLSLAQLEGAYLNGAHLEGADLLGAHLDGASLLGVHLTGANLVGAHLERASLSEAHLEGADLGSAHVEGADLGLAHLESARLIRARLQGATLRVAHLEGATLRAAQLVGADLSMAYLEGANFTDAHLQGADLSLTHLEGADLTAAHLEGADLRDASCAAKTYPTGDEDLQRIRTWVPDFPNTLPPATLTGAFLDTATNLAGVTWLGEADPTWSSWGPTLADVHWGAANLIVVNWEPILRLADERSGYMPRNADGFDKERATRVDDFRAAGRAYRLLSVALRAQGLTADATRFHYRAELMDRKAYWHRFAVGRWLYSWLLGTFAGYGDRLVRLFLTYGVTVLAFALAMLIAAGQVPANQPLSLATLQDVLVLSVTSFHSRGLQPPGLHLDDVLATLAGIEAVFGLLIEGLFIAAFTRRVTGG